MSTMRLIETRSVTYGKTNKPGQIWTYYDSGKGIIHYELHAGELGKGRIVTKATCAWGYVPQTQAMDKMKHAACGITITPIDND